MEGTGSALDELRSVADLSRLPGMARVGINIERAIGVSIPECRKIARRHRDDHRLAQALWDTRIHEARIVAGMVDDASQVGPEQMDRWASDFDSWDLCDQVCSNLFVHTPHARRAAERWMKSDLEFVKRSGFSLLAVLAVHGADADDAWLAWLPAIRRGALDERNYVKKSVSWALRQIGKRNLVLNTVAIEEAERLCAQDSRSARWIGRAALRELRSDQVRARLEGSASSKSGASVR